MNTSTLFELRNPHSILAAIRRRPHDVREVRVNPRQARGAWEQVIEAAGQQGIAISSRVRGGGRNRQGDRRRGTERQGAGVALVAPPAPAALESLLTEPATGQLLLALDCLQDPQNVGAVLRSASFFGAAGVITTRDKSAPINATVCDIAAGGIEHVPFHVATNLSRALQVAREAGFWILGTSEHAEQSVFDIDDRPWVVVIGSEQSGIRRLTADKCDELCRLEPRGAVTSLNAAAATSAVLTALTRPRS